jgi:AraC family transcriptional regulator
MFDDVTDAQSPGRTRLLHAIGPEGSETLGLRHFRCDGAPALAGLSDRHTIILNRSSFVGISCTIGRRRLDHTGMAGNVTLIPAEVDWTANANGALDNIVVTIAKPSFAVAAARADRPSATMTPQISGQDSFLSAIIDEMIDDVASPTEPGDIWRDLTDELLDHLTDSYGLGVRKRARGFLTPEKIGRINAYLADRLEQKVSIDELAEVALQSASHFPRIFRRTVGLSPHQYVVRLRLLRARELIDAGIPLAEAAIGSGFTDQSHLSFWARRVYGAPPGRWAAARQ